MSTDIDQAFVRQYESDVHMAYQRMGSKLANTIRKKTNVKGESTTFQTVGRGSASQKSRHGNVPTMNISHAPVVCPMQDWYAADYIDDLDELKINHDEKMVQVESGAAALGRKQDEIILSAFAATTSELAGTAAAISQTEIDAAFKWMGDADVPENDRFWVVSPAGWLDLMAIVAFTNADYIGQNDLPYKGGMVAKSFMGFTFFGHSGLPGPSTAKESFAYHRSSTGSGSGKEISSRMDFVPEKDSIFANNKMSMGAVLIDTIGCYKVTYNEDT